MNSRYLLARDTILEVCQCRKEPLPVGLLASFGVHGYAFRTRFPDISTSLQVDILPYSSAKITKCYFSSWNALTSKKSIHVTMRAFWAAFSPPPKHSTPTSSSCVQSVMAISSGFTQSASVDSFPLHRTFRTEKTDFLKSSYKCFSSIPLLELRSEVPCHYQRLIAGVVKILTTAKP